MKQGVDRVSDGVVRLPLAPMSDAELVAGLRLGDSRAAGELFDRFAPKINGKMWRLLGADNDHDDLVHQVFIHILNGIGKLKNPDSLEDWIYGITVNTVRREIRRRRYRRILVPMAEPPEQVARLSSPDDQLVVGRFYRVLDAMRPDDRIVFSLRFVEGRSLGEVAAAGDYSLSTAKRRLSRAKREFLRKAAKDPVLAALVEEIRNAG